MSTIHGKKIGKSYRNNKFETSALMWTEKIELPDGSSSVSYTQNYFEYIIKKHDALLGQKAETLAYNPPVKIYFKIELHLEKTKMVKVCRIEKLLKCY